MDASLESLLITWTDPAALGAGAIALGLIVFIAWRVRQVPPPTVDPKPAQQDQAAPEGEKKKLTAGKARTVAEMVEDEEVDTTSVLSRFVLNTKGETIGETLGLHGDDIVLKHEGKFLVVAQDDILEKDGVLLADANVDWDEARRRGEQWRADSQDEMQYDDEGMPVLDKES